MAKEQIKARRMWPVVMFIDKRRDKVKGRMKRLTSSTRERRKAKGKGLPKGTKLEKKVIIELSKEDLTDNCQKIVAKVKRIKVCEVNG